MLMSGGGFSERGLGGFGGKGLERPNEGIRGSAKGWNAIGFEYIPKLGRAEEAIVQEVRGETSRYALTGQF